MSTEPTLSSEASGLVVDYESFKDWEPKSWSEKNQICNDFYEKNSITSEVALDKTNTGEEIVDWYYHRYGAAWELNKDMSNTENGAIALNLVDCMTKVRAENDIATKNTLTTAFEYARESTIELPNYPIDRVTRYSDGLATFVGKVGYTREGGTPDDAIWSGKRVEYVKIGELGEEITQEAYEWDYDTLQWHSVTQVSGDAEVEYGAVPPIVVDPSRADAPYKTA